VAVLLYAIGRLVGYGGIVIPAGLIGLQSFMWMKTGSWNPLPVGVAFVLFDIPFPDTNWAGLHKIYAWLIDLPLSLVIFLFGVIVGTALTLLAEELSTNAALKSDQQSNKNRAN